MSFRIPPRAAPTVALPKFLANHPEAAKRLNPEGKIRRVFYPLGGPDISTPLALFTGPKGGPKEIMIVDALSFGTKAHREKVASNLESRRVFFRDYEYYGYASVDHALPKMEVAGVGIQWHLQELDATNLKWLGARTEAVLFRSTVPGGYDTLNAIKLTGLDTARALGDAKLPGEEYWKKLPSRAWGSTPYADNSGTPKAPRYPSQEE